jgi:tRNA A37 threonylcarbamoyladenosine synthetase subunit TsaC/SUA5/YrdC
MYTTQMLDNRNLAHLDQVVDLIAQGQIVAFGLNGIFAFLGDADQEIAAQRMATAKRQQLDKTLALVCAPEYLDEFVDLGAPAFGYHALDKIQQLQRELYSLGVILPAAGGIPPYMMRDDTILNVWFEYPPHHPVRYLHEQIRRRGLRAFVGTSTNRHGEVTYVDPIQTLRIFGGAIPAIVTHDLRTIPLHRRRSSTLVDFTGEFPRLVRAGSVPVEELRAHLRRTGLGELRVDDQVAEA